MYIYVQMEREKESRADSSYGETVASYLCHAVRDVVKETRWRGN